MNQESLAQAVQSLMKEIEPESFRREGLQDTPRRVAKAYETLFSGYQQKLEDIVTLFDQEAYDEMVLVKDIEFYSTCEHHMLPFFGKLTLLIFQMKKLLVYQKYQEFWKCTVVVFKIRSALPRRWPMLYRKF